MSRAPEVFYRTPDYNAKPAHLLVAEDDPSTAELLALRLKVQGHRVDTVPDGTAAWDYLLANAAALDAVVLDRMMPGIDGMELMHRMNGTPEMAHLPVVMHTAADRPEQIRQGVEAGVFYYLTKPCPEEVMNAVIGAAIRESAERKMLTLDLRRERGGHRLVGHSVLSLRTLEEAESAACWLAHAFEDPRRVVYGLAALLINAVEHGCAGLGFEAKGRALKEGIWRQEVAARLEEPTNRKKRVGVELTRVADVVEVRIRDDGPGFEWKKFINMDASRAQSSHGRGIPRARAVNFDGLQYNAEGNEVKIWVNDKV